jgi:murein DD-endopeptidase MepM/ murein hydrolase activator NlpD
MLHPAPVQNAPYHHPQRRQLLRPLAALSGLLMPVTVGAEVIVWPTPSPAFQQGAPYTEWVQPTATGEPGSALFGCVRNDADRFHEGIDIAPVQARRRGEATDPVYAVMAGRVAYINKTAGNSGYGRYVVLLHDAVAPAVYTLYAHLQSVAADLATGQHVPAGATIGGMGRSAGGYQIPRERAHLHFEIGLRLSDDFERWYRRQKYTTANQHGLYNGINLLGFDPLDWFTARRTQAGLDMTSYLRGVPVGFILKVRSARTPDFVRRYPALVDGPLPPAVAGWRIAFSAWGLPLRWTPLAAQDLIDLRHEGEVAVEAIQPEVLASFACRNLLDQRGQGVRLGRGARQLLEILFGFE